MKRAAYIPEVYFIFLLAGAGCVERFNFTPDEPVSLLVVDGSIHQGEGPFYIKLSRTSAFGSGLQPELDAHITLYNDQGESESFAETYPGIYEVGGHIVKGIPGTTYYIEIVSGENMYRSEPQTMPPVIEADSAYFDVNVTSMVDGNGNISERRRVNVYVDSPVKQENHDALLRWSTDVSYSVTERVCNPIKPPSTCYVTDTVNTQNIIIFNSERIEATRLSRFFLFTQPTDPIYAFYTRYYVNVYQYSLNKEAFVYWGKLQKIANEKGNIFDTPPAAVPGNIYNINNSDEMVLGFFEASTVDTVHTNLNRGDLAPLPVPEFCGFGVNSQPNDRNACCNCLLLPNSSKDRPAYWD